ncbi:Hypothetical predicted protein [Cloeon dipterum]|uniref:Uncharacterized protein n=1 Tax=Cloeon dipterum TaxID=197152 RepID=A0A8S1DL68_9INSE|nr:Hypothetical predicted protein [Cloeon dipterum]
MEQELERTQEQLVVQIAGRDSVIWSTQRWMMMVSTWQVVSDPHLPPSAATRRVQTSRTEIEREELRIYTLPPPDRRVRYGENNLFVGKECSRVEIGFKVTRQDLI